MFGRKMTFVCPVCLKRKDFKKKNNQTCLDCFNETQLRKQGKKTKEEERNEWQESVRRREEEMLETQNELDRKHEEIMRRENEVTKQEKGVARRELVIQEKGNKLIETTLKRKRLGDDGPTGRVKRFCDLGQRRRQQLVSNAVEELKGLGRSEVEEILREVNRRVFGEDDVISQVQQLKENVALFCATQLPSLPDRSRIAAILTRGLSLNEAEEISGVRESSLSWGRHEVSEGRFKQQEVSQVRTKS